MAGPGIEADIPPDGSSEKGRLQGTVRLSGQLLPEFGLREVLAQVRELDEQYSLLRILSKGVRGYIGITNSNIISGGYVTSTSEYGIVALRKLLSAHKGIFVVMAMSDHPIELRQSLKLSIDDLLTYRAAGQQPTMADALLFFETRHGELFALDAAAEKAATQGGELAEFESYMAWGGEAPVLSNNLSKITGSFGKAKITSGSLPPVSSMQDVSGAQPVFQPAPPAVEMPPPVPQQQPEEAAAAPANMGWAEDKSKKVTEALERAAKSHIPIAVPVEQIPEDEPPPTIPPQLRKTSSRLKPAVDVPKGDDEQSISQKIRTLRDEQIASQKLNLEDLEDEIQRPMNAMSPGERRKHELIMIGTWLAGIGLTFALGQQIFTIANASARYHSGMEALKNGDYARAEVDLTTAAQSGGNQRAYLYLAIAESRLGHGDVAMKDFDELLAQNPKDSLARAAKAALLINQKQYQQAIDECNQIIKYDDQYGDAYRLLSVAYCDLEDWKSAIDSATNCLSAKINDKGKAEALASRAYAQFKVKKYDQAIDDYAQAIEIESKNAQLYSSRGLAFKKMQKWKEAIADISKGIELDANNASLYKLRADCWKHTGNWPKAATDLDMAAKLKPSTEAFKLRAAARLATKNFEGALEDYEYLLKVDPSDKEVKAGYESAKLGLTDGKPVLLSDWLKKETAQPAAMVIKGTPAELVDRGYKAMNARHIGEAVEFLKAALKADPSNLNGRRYLAYCLVQGKQYQAAGVEFAQLSQISTLSTEDRVMYAKSLYLDHKYDAAGRMYGTVLSQYPTHDEARQGLINSLIDSGKSAEAVALCQEGMTRNPAMAATYKMLLNVALHPIDQTALDKYKKK